MGKIIATSGKGGVGKSTVSHAIAVSLAGKGIKTLIVDCDKEGGKATRRTLSPRGNLELKPNAISYTGTENLYAGAIAPLEFWDLPRMDDVGKMSRKDRDKQFANFMGQFPGEYGLVAYNILFNQFFGVSSNPEQVADFVSLARILRDGEKMGVEQIVLDLEPTTGTKRTLVNATHTAKTLRDMSEYSMAKVIAIGLQFPDIKRFLGTGYIHSAEHHGNFLMEYAEMISGADYTLVCGPEEAMVAEMLEDVGPIVRSFGGNVSRYVINNCRSNLSEVESLAQTAQIKKVMRAASRNNVPACQIKHDSNLNSRVSDEERLFHLRKVGDYLLS